MGLPHFHCNVPLPRTPVFCCSFVLVVYLLYILFSSVFVYQCFIERRVKQDGLCASSADSLPPRHHCHIILRLAKRWHFSLSCLSQHGRPANRWGSAATQDRDQRTQLTSFALLFIHLVLYACYQPEDAVPALEVTTLAH